MENLRNIFHSFRFLVYRKYPLFFLIYRKHEKSLAKKKQERYDKEKREGAYHA